MLIFSIFNSKLLVPILVPILFGLIIFLGVWGLERAPLQYWDESTNLAVILESSEISGGPTTDLYYAGENFWEKPPLWYFLMQAFASVYNNSEREFISIFEMLTLVRFTTLITSIVLIYFVYRYLKSNHGQIAAKISLAFFAFIPALWVFNPSGVFSSHNFRSADSDVLQLLFIFLGFICAEKILVPKTVEKVLTRKTLALVFGIGIFTALALLTKGIFGIFPVFWLGLNLLYRAFILRHLDIKLLKIIIIAGITTLIIILPWHVYMYANYGGDFVDIYLFYHQLGRGLTSLEGHTGGLLFHINNQLNPLYSPLLLILLSILLLILFLNRKSELQKVSKKQINRPLIAAGLILFLITLVQTKLSWYALYLYPFLISGVAITIRDFIQIRMDKNRAIGKNMNLQIFALIISLIFLGITFNYSFIQQASTKNQELNNIRIEQTAHLNYRLDRIGHVMSLDAKSDKNRQFFIPARPNLSETEDKLKEICGSAHGFEEILVKNDIDLNMCFASIYARAVSQKFDGEYWHWECLR